MVDFEEEGRPEDQAKDQQGYHNLQHLATATVEHAGRSSAALPSIMVCFDLAFIEKCTVLESNDISVLLSQALVFPMRRSLFVKSFRHPSGLAWTPSTMLLNSLSLLSFPIAGVSCMRHSAKL